LLGQPAHESKPPHLDDSTSSSNIITSKHSEIPIDCELPKILTERESETGYFTILIPKEIWSEENSQDLIPEPREPDIYYHLLNLQTQNIQIEGKISNSSISLSGLSTGKYLLKIIHLKSQNCMEIPLVVSHPQIQSIIWITLWGLLACLSIPIYLFRNEKIISTGGGAR
jgi:hypothetical protein